MVQWRKCEFISAAVWEWIEELLSCCHSYNLMGTSLPPGLSFSPPPLSHLTDSSSVLLSPAVISCQLTGGKKRPINKFNTRSWHLCCSCQLWQTCRQKEWWGNVMALIFTGLNWDIYTNPSQLALHWINTAHVLPKYECVSCKHKFTARVVQRDGDYSSTSKCCVCLVLCTMPSLMQKKKNTPFLFIHLFTLLCFLFIDTEGRQQDIDCLLSFWGLFEEGIHQPYTAHPHEGLPWASSCSPGWALLGAQKPSADLFTDWVLGTKKAILNPEA